MAFRYWEAESKYSDSARKRREQQIIIVILVLAVSLAAVRGCLFFRDDGVREKEARIVVTVDFGNELLYDEKVLFSFGESAMDVIGRHLHLETSYGGGFIEGIDGISSDFGMGILRDWFFYVNGVLAPEGASSYRLNDGDSVLLDFHSWDHAIFSAPLAMCFPEPFLHGYGGSVPEIVIVSEQERDVSKDIKKEMQAEGIRIKEIGDSIEKGISEHSESYLIAVLSPEELFSIDGLRGFAENPHGYGQFSRYEIREEELYAIPMDVEGKEIGEYLCSGFIQFLGKKPGDGNTLLVICADSKQAFETLTKELFERRAEGGLMGLILLEDGRKLRTPLPAAEKAMPEFSGSVN